jgi:hypothetical protein
VELVDNVLKVIFRRISIVRLDGRLVILVDQTLVVFGRAWLNLRFRTTTFNTIIKACEILLRGWGQSQIGRGRVPSDYCKGRIVHFGGQGAESRMSLCEVLSVESRGGRRRRGKVIGMGIGIGMGIRMRMRRVYM